MAFLGCAKWREGHAVLNGVVEVNGPACHLTCEIPRLRRQGFMLFGLNANHRSQAIREARSTMYAAASAAGVPVREYH